MSRGQRLLDWSDSTTTTPTQPRISAAASDGHTLDNVTVHEHVEPMIRQIHTETEAIKMSDASTSHTNTMVEDENMRLVLRRLGDSDSAIVPQEKLTSKKRKAAKLELRLEDGGRYASKRARLDNAGQGKGLPEAIGDKRRRKHGRHRNVQKPKRNSKRCKHCPHCDICNMQA